MQHEPHQVGLAKALLIGALALFLTVLFSAVVAFSVATVLGTIVGVVAGISLFIGASANASNIWFGIILFCVLQGFLILSAYLLIRFFRAPHQEG